MKSTKEVSMSTVINSLPSADGFSMPGEFASHHGCLMIWPVRRDPGPSAARRPGKYLHRRRKPSPRVKHFI